MTIKQSIPLTPTGTSSLADLAITAPVGASRDALVHVVDLPRARTDSADLRKGTVAAAPPPPRRWRAPIPRILRAPVLLAILVTTWLALLASTARLTVRYVPFQLVLIAYLATRLARVSVTVSANRATIPALAAAVPLAGYFVLFALPTSFPDAWFPRIDTESLPVMDTALVGMPAHWYFQEYSVPRDVVAWVLYGVMHFVSPVIVGSGALVWGIRVGPRMPGNAELPGLVERKRGWKEGVRRVARAVQWVDKRGGMLKAYVVVFACCNLAGVMCFGAFPSLHAAYAVLAAIFVGDQFPWLHIGKVRIPTAVLGTVYAAGMWWATMYFAHHYLIDLLGGSALAVACYLAARKKITEVRRALVEGGEVETGGIDG
ncbi:hypothetical protein AMAG_11324 [Allomyces macrogynus ATCC 38327]|uniref:Inositolphosphotransferase Aur1/Ipt1 domain-containing protein n=1 Tax=Allomyces macrogynus (strain ATCC 38327) TaxID=578462 RepID=A0A0L0SWJ1_ALLM3|nr:hypothetical protein AMAG_11324 [Allomyces macrogynus ATCC 38327]|eukprot:KNE66841.1 hypothetical protein AMAG_11324 [Allomyces macrogynus ATCC 38327]